MYSYMTFSKNKTNVRRRNLKPQYQIADIMRK